MIGRFTEIYIVTIQAVRLGFGVNRDSASPVVAISSISRFRFSCMRTKLIQFRRLIQSKKRDTGLFTSPDFALYTKDAIETTSDVQGLGSCFLSPKSKAKPHAIARTTIQIVSRTDTSRLVLQMVSSGGANRNANATCFISSS